MALPLLVCASADAAPVRARLPEVVRGGAWVTVRGRAPADASAVLERRRSGAWTAVSPVRRARGRSFSLRWRAPRHRGVVVLRVVARRSGRVIGISAARRVGVTLTAVLGASRIASAPPPGVAGTLRYRGRSGALQSGEFVAAGAGGATPSGLLARVVAVRRDRGDTVARMVPAGLLEAVPEGRLSLGGAALRGGAVGQPARSRSFRLPLTCRADAGGHVSGTLSVTLAPALALSWSGGALRSVRASAALHGRAQLSAAVDGPAGCTLAETPVGTWLWPPLRGFVGPVPVVVVPRTTLYVAGEARTSAAAAASVQGRMSATAGLRWDAGEVRPLGSFSHAFTAPEPSVSGDAELGARVIPSVTFLVYGQAGPRFDLAAGLRLRAGSDRQSPWELTAPVELRAGFSLPAFSGLTIPQRTVFSRSFPLAAAGAPGPAAPADPPGTRQPSDPAGSPNSGDSAAPGSPALGRERARIEWEGAATDVDLHVWDGAGHHAWFRDPTAIPDGALSEDDRHGFGPETFHDASSAGRGLTYGICYFDDAGSWPTDVRVRLTEPDGSVRSSTVRLASEGDHALVGSTGAGATVAQPVGWCSP